MPSHSRFLFVLILLVGLAQAKCRFSPLFTQEEVLRNSSGFESDMFYWDGQFHAVGHDLPSGVTYDHCRLNETTGLCKPCQCSHSDPVNEALHIMMLTHAVAGNAQASRFVYSQNPSDAAQWAAAILNNKLKAYMQFNLTFPDHGGFLPPFTINSSRMFPAQGWSDRVSARENGQLLWSVYALVHVLHQSNATEFYQLGDSWGRWLDYTRANLRAVFYTPAARPGHVCKVSTFKGREYTCKKLTGLLIDPFEEELMTWWLHFFGQLSIDDKEALWQVKRPLLQAVEYVGSTVNSSLHYHGAADYCGLPVVGRNISPITVQKGSFFGSQEQWKLLQLPYLDVPIVKRLFTNAERVRTCNSWLMGDNAGLYAASYNITIPDQLDAGTVPWAGVPAVAAIQYQELDLITPYAAFPVILVDRAVGLAWYKNMIDANGMQSPYGSTAAGRRDGTAIAALVDWSSKAPTLLALLGGVVDVIRQAMKADAIYDEFIDIVNREHSAVFGTQLNGEDVDLCLPNFELPYGGVKDFTMCRSA